MLSKLLMRDLPRDISQTRQLYSHLHHHLGISWVLEQPHIIKHLPLYRWYNCSWWRTIPTIIIKWTKSTSKHIFFHTICISFNWAIEIMSKTFYPIGSILWLMRLQLNLHPHLNITQPFQKNKHSYKFCFHHVKTSSYPSFWYWKSRTPIQTDWTSYSTQKFPTWLLQLSVWYFSLIEDLLPFKPFVLVSLHFLSSWIIYKKKEITIF